MDSSEKQVNTTITCFEHFDALNKRVAQLNEAWNARNTTYDEWNKRRFLKNTADASDALKAELFDLRERLDSLDASICTLRSCIYHDAIKLREQWRVFMAGEPEVTNE
jgi:hypothetical protein